MSSFDYFWTSGASIVGAQTKITVHYNGGPDYDQADHNSSLASSPSRARRRAMSMHDITKQHRGWTKEEFLSHGCVGGYKVPDPVAQPMSPHSSVPVVGGSAIGRRRSVFEYPIPKSKIPTYTDKPSSPHSPSGRRSSLIPPTPKDPRRTSIVRIQESLQPDETASATMARTPIAQDIQISREVVTPRTPVPPSHTLDDDLSATYRAQDLQQDDLEEILEPYVSGNFQCCWTFLDLSHNPKLGNDAIAELANQLHVMEFLQSLLLRDVGITDGEALEALELAAATHPCLSVIDISGNKIVQMKGEPTKVIRKTCAGGGFVHLVCQNNKADPSICTVM